MDQKKVFLDYGDLNLLKQEVEITEDLLKRHCQVGKIPDAVEVGIAFMSCRNDIIILAKLGLEYIEKHREKK